MKKYLVNYDHETVDPEESLLEAVSPNSRIEKPINSAFFMIFYFAVSLLFVVFILAAFNIGVFKNNYFAALSAENRFITISVAPNRGIIYSKDGTILAENKKTYNLWFLPGKFSSNKDELTENLAQLFNTPNQSIADLFLNKSSQASFLVKEDISQEEKEKILSLNTKGLEVTNNNTRLYNGGNIFSHLMGYVSLVSENDLVKNSFYKINDKIGRSGLESYYESELRGQSGEILINRFNDEKKFNQEKKGSDLVLNIDSELQKDIYFEMENGLKQIGSQVGVAVALDPRNGRVLSLISFPSYDNNAFVKGLNTEEYQSLFANKKEPLLNRTIAGRFVPGSTIKPLVALAALEEKVISPAKKINAPGFITIENPYDPKVIYTFRDWKNHGFVNMREAIANSSDIYFYTVGGGFYDIKGLGIGKIAEYFKKFKLDTALGIDLNGEVSGFIPTPEWKSQYRNEIWYQGDTFNVSIGQGDLLVTPLWLTSYIAAFGNRGIIYQPFIVDKVLDPTGSVIKVFEPKILSQIAFDKENLEVVREGMKMAAEVGTASVLKGLPFEVGAKSGTAEVIKDQSTSSWISVFAPYDNPQIVLTIMMESGKEGSYIPHQIAYRVLKEYFK